MGISWGKRSPKAPHGEIFPMPPPKRQGGKRSLPGVNPGWVESSGIPGHLIISGLRQGDARCGKGTLSPECAQRTEVMRKVGPAGSWRVSPALLPMRRWPKGEAGVMTRISFPSKMTSVPPAPGPMK